MNDVLIVVLVFTAVGIAALALNKFLNRKPMEVMRAARQKLIEQAQALQEGNVDRFVNECGLASEDRAAARRILEFFAKLLDVPPERIAQDYDMRRLFVLPASEVESELHPFSTEIVEWLGSRSDKQRWEQRWSETPDLPSNEDALVRFIMGMSLAQVLQFFAPLIKRSS